MYTLAFPDKAAMLAGLHGEQQVAVTSTAYAGDQSEDSSASNANGLAFCMAPWGYRVFPPDDTSAHWITMASPSDLPCN